MPLIYQHNINETTKAGIWHIEEPEEYFLSKVPLKKDVLHPHKRLQHLAGRSLLPALFSDFPLEEILIADTRKPFLENEKYHFSISHCGDYAAAIASSTNRVGVDIELVTSKIERVKHKFLSAEELGFVSHHKPIPEMLTMLTVMWSMKEAVFKWYGDGEMDFIKHMQIQPFVFNTEGGTVDVQFLKSNNSRLTLHYRHFDSIVMSWVIS
ncbi:MAG: 4'-phosphopantetheinyl transferase superfamily protein [Sphingobacteriales bacterium]|nr:4'-phosphopantetheinyl transferase superfamily protein [Sphingobacteriales bacterium]MBI3720902.1 4'-phosphopantetheinyl transferase superfamily protein [Sphingobacteriales bacterium]